MFRFIVMHLCSILLDWIQIGQLRQIIRISQPKTAPRCVLAT